MKKFFVIVILSVAIGVLFFYFKDEIKNNEPKPPLKQEEIQYTQYFVAISKFTNTKTNYSIEEIIDADLVTTYDNYELLKDTYPVATVLEENLFERLDQDSIAILRPEQVRPEFKTLIIDGINFWEKDFDNDNYPLKIISESEPIQEEKYYFFAGGEIIPTRAVDRLGLNIHDNYTYLFDFFAQDIKNAELAIALLENALNGNPTPCKGCMLFESDDRVGQGLKDVGFNFLSLAGNHAGDAGQKAMKNTIDILDSLGIQHTGSTSGDYQQSIKPITKEINNKKVGMISADDVAYYYWYAGDSSKYFTTNFSKRTTNGIIVPDITQIDKIKKIKEENEIDYLIVYMSWGVEYTNKPTKHQQELAYKLIDNGVDLILASHPHWVQSIEFYKEKPIIYSMGNFIFDQTHTLPTRQGMVTKLHYFGNDLKSIELLPLQTCGYHQTTNDLAKKYLGNEITIDEVYNFDEKQGCVYWQPIKLKEDHPSYKQILERTFQYTKVG
jgi:poly-gamma-glutamate capsule biosynthesis protein CapA/YwtB (metallophosphatase superfamily)